MAVISIDLPDAILMKVMQSAMAEKRTLEAHVIATLVASVAPEKTQAQTNTQSQPVTVDVVIERAIKHVTALNGGYEFFLANVCNAEDWEALDAGQRKSLGKKFRIKMSELGLADWKERSGNNHALYVRRG
jgi:hypothetical protein